MHILRDMPPALPRRLSCILVSVNYGDELAKTLPENIPLFDELIVVTTPEDERTQTVAKMYGAKIVLSRRCYDDHHVFNKGRMLNDGLAALEQPDWVLFTDADIFMNQGLRAFVLHHPLDPECLYFTMRGELKDITGQPAWMNAQPNGYFQLFHPRAAALSHRSWPQVVNENFCSAGSVDSWFSQQWSKEKQFVLEDVRVMHLSSDKYTQNWNGKQSQLGKWVQFGIYTGHTGFKQTLALDHMPEEIKLTDTLYGESIVIPEGDIGKYMQVDSKGRLYFHGKPLDWRHVHIACIMTEELLSV